MNLERPNFTINIVCLANSRKTTGRCIAGKEIDGTGKTGQWIRLISSRPTHEISELEMLYSDGETVRLLEVMEIPCEKPAPQGHQPENVLIDARFFWQRRDRANWQALNQMLDEPDPLWISGFSTRQGQNNRIPENLLNPQQGSLRLIALDQILLHAGPKAPRFGDMKQKAMFISWSPPSSPGKERRVMNEPVLTIGHSNHSVEYFIDLLRRHCVTAVGDVRSHPYSRHVPQFSQDALREALLGQNIAYVFLGKELGARSRNPACYVRGKAQYDRMAREPLFVQGLARISQGIRQYRIALMCAEKDPIECHRAILVARYLVKNGFRVSHIHANDELETHDALENRLLKILKMPEGDMLKSREEYVEEAYSIQGERIAYEDQKVTPLEIA